MKKNISKKAVLLSLLLASSVMVSAQTVIPIVPNILSGAVAKTATEAATREVAARSFEEGLRAGGQWYITQSLLVGQEVMLGVNQSEVGSPSYQKYHKVRNATDFLGKSLSASLARALARSEKHFKEFPAYYSSFEDELVSSGRTLGVYEGILEAAFGEQTRFGGTFVHTFNEVTAFMNTPCTLTAQEALDTAAKQAKTLQNGFFVISVAGENGLPKDVLLLDIRNNRFISLKQSRDSIHARTARANKATVQ